MKRSWNWKDRYQSYESQNWNVIVDCHWSNFLGLVLLFHVSKLNTKNIDNKLDVDYFVTKTAIIDNSVIFKVIEQVISYYIIIYFIIILLD